MSLRTTTILSQVMHGFYINLESRRDRKEHVEKQLDIIHMKNKVERFAAIRMTNGAIGCSMSHLKCLEIAKKKNWDNVFICEDDIEFLQPEMFVSQLNGFLSSNATWDVILLAGNVAGTTRNHDIFSVRVSKCQTTTGYIVNKHYYDTLINNIKEGIEHLMREPHLHTIYAIDKYWFHLQDTDYWYIIIPLSVIQREDYSNIERRCTNYKDVMLNLNKPYLKLPAHTKL